MEKQSKLCLLFYYLNTTLRESNIAKLIMAHGIISDINEIFDKYFIEYY